jgi:hypothetical protein
MLMCWNEMGEGHLMIMIFNLDGTVGQRLPKAKCCYRLGGPNKIHIEESVLRGIIVLLINIK